MIPGNKRVLSKEYFGIEAASAFVPGTPILFSINNSYFLILVSEEGITFQT